MAWLASVMPPRFGRSVRAAVVPFASTSQMTALLKPLVLLARAQPPMTKPPETSELRTIEVAPLTSKARS